MHRGNQHSCFTAARARAQRRRGDATSIPAVTVASSSISVTADAARRTPGILISPLRPTPRRILLADIEQLRDLRRAERWLLFGGSSDVTLGLAYAEMHANRVSEAIFFSITAGTRKELDWITRQPGRFFPRPGRNFRPESQRQIAMAILLMPTLACSPVPTLRFKPRRPRLVRIGGRGRGDPPRPETIGLL